MKRRNRKLQKKDIGIFILVGVIVVEIIALTVLFKSQPAKRQVKVLPKGKIAIVLDDWGYNQRNVKYLKNIDSPLTISILPDLSYSRKIAEAARKNKKEIILHLPLEPHPYESMGLELNTIKTSMSNRTIIRLLNKSIKSVPYLKGVSSHMGSKATEDEKIMGTIFHELKKRRLYFLDSLATAKSVCEKVAKKSRLDYAKRNTFLDNKQDAGYIKQQLAVLVKVAEEKGQAIGIGHDKRITLEVLEEEIPRLEEEGFLFVFLSDLVN